jgi:NodT family efflux transporter outer membrane factor (OMF) lipoprotein
MKPFSRHIILISATLIIITGCASGPDFRVPETGIPAQYPTSSTAAKPEKTPLEIRTEQHFVPDRDIPGEWWTLFRSPELDRMIKQALADSPTLTAAQAALRKAEENLRAVKGSVLYPAVDANLQANRQKVSGNANTGASDTYNLYNASVSVSYTLDIFGGGRRQMEAYQAQVDYQRYQYEATYLTLIANIVTTAIKEASFREQLTAKKEIIEIQQKQLDVIKKQFELGAVTKADVLSQEAEAAATKAELPDIEKQFDLTRHALSILVGKFPGSSDMPEFKLESLHLPQELPVSLPSSLAHHRPDIRAYEALLHQACAEVGVATANLYPQITLSAGYGFEAIGTNILFNGESAVWNLGAGLLQPVFHGGELTAKRKAAIAAYDQTKAQYKQTILEAFQDVADVLRELEADAKTLKAQTEAETIAKSALELIEKQYELGAVGYPALLISQRDYEKTKVNVITAKAQQYADTAALFQALGGGWWNRKSDSLNADYVQGVNE